jgi:hypothetical protein
VPFVGADKAKAKLRVGVATRRRSDKVCPLLHYTHVMHYNDGRTEFDPWAPSVREGLARHRPLLTVGVPACSGGTLTDRGSAIGSGQGTSWSPRHLRPGGRLAAEAAWRGLRRLKAVLKGYLRVQSDVGVLAEMGEEFAFPPQSN